MSGEERKSNQFSHEKYNKEHILVCLSSSPSNSRIIKTATLMAQAFGGKFTALFVETPKFSSISDEDRERLQEHIVLAQKSGAKIETVYGDNIPFQIAEFARLSEVTKIVIGRSAVGKRHPWDGPTLTDRLIELTPNLDIHIIPDVEMTGYREKEPSFSTFTFSWKDSLISIVMLVLATALTLFMNRAGFNESNIVTTFLLSVLIISILTTGKMYCVLSSLATVVIFNFFFTAPKYTLRAYDQGYTITFLIMFISAMIAGTLANRLKLVAKQTAKAAYRTRILLEANQKMGKSHEEEELRNVLGRMLLRLLNRDIIICLKNREQTICYFSPENEMPEMLNDDSYPDWIREDANKNIIPWVMDHNQKAGSTTDYFSNANGLYYAIRVGENVYGVVGIDVRKHKPEEFENGILLSIIGDCALAMENLKNQKEKEETALIAQQETLRANLLRTMSHDIRTPLTSIYGNASILSSDGENISVARKKLLYENICEDSAWLIQLVENLLAVTKIEDGKMHLHLQLELMADVIEEALLHIDSKSKEHEIIVEESESYAMARIDAGLITQVIVNIVNNAIRYTQKGSKIIIRTLEKDGKIFVKIIDDGPGISDEDKKHIFDMFYSSNHKVIDGKRSLGLGLALCKSILLAHDGNIYVEDSVPRGTVFSFYLPIEEVQLNMK